MRLYLSSYRIGDETERLREMTSENVKTAFIPNAMDGYEDSEQRRMSIEQDLQELRSVGLVPEVIDLKDYFGKEHELKDVLQDTGVIWASGGNTFVLRQAMKLSGLDKLLRELWLGYSNVVYGGYSAGACVMCPTLEGIHLADDPDKKPYGPEHETVWEGLGMVEYCIAPHYKSDHVESPLIDKTIAYYIDNKILFKALKDGEVIILE